MPELSGSASIRVSRRIAADPTSTALLLAAPAAVELWPGARQLGERDGAVVVEAQRSEGASQVKVRALPPRRTPTAFVLDFDWTGDDVPDAAGRLRLAYAPTGDGTPVTHAVLELEPAGDDAAARLTAGAEAFLANLARAAETRNRAA